MQQEYKVYIKGMVCGRCISTVRKELADLGWQTGNIELGEVTILDTGTPPDLKLIGERLAKLGFSLLEDKGRQMVDGIRQWVEKVYGGGFDFPDGFRFSKLLSEKLHRSYDVLSAAFSTAEGITLEKYVIAYRIEKVKELLVYTDDTLATIAFRLGFSSEAHLSRQFRAQTGLNPSHFRKVRKEKTSGQG